MEFLGRTDHQVKIRGLRIELGEIEHALCAHPAVRQAVVTLRDDGGRKQLVAYLLARPGADAPGNAGPSQVSGSPSGGGLGAAGPWGHSDTLVPALVQGLHEQLPDYMVPAAFVLLDELPLNANGKVDRARLPEPGPAAYARAPRAEPEGEHERALHAIWQQVLGLADIGVTDGFFALGGDSILAIQVAARAARQGLAIQPRHVIEDKTIRRLAARLAGAAPAAGAAAAAVAQGAPSAAADAPPGAAGPAPAQGEQRLLPIQLDFLHGDRTDLDRYGHCARIALPAHVDAALLHGALRTLLARHDVLRLKFRETGGGWIAQYRPELLAPTPEQLGALLTTVDLASVPAERHAEVAAEAESRAQASLDIRQGRLLQWVWLRGGETPQLLWLMHHLVVDGVSWRVLLGELQTLLAQPAGVLPPADAANYQAWAAALHTQAYGTALECERDHWLRQLTQPAARVPLQATESGVDDLEQHTACVPVTLDADATTQLLRELPRHDVRPVHLLIAALARTLGAWLGSDGVRIDLEGHGREPIDAGDAASAGLDVGQTVGWFTTLYPVHLSGLRADARRQLQSTREQLEAVPHHGIGWGLLRHLAHDEALLAALEPLGAQASDVLFNYLGQFGAGERGGSFVSPRRRRTHPLRVNAWVQDGVLTVQFDHSVRQLAPATVEALAQRFVQTLRELIGVGLGGSAAGAEPYALAGLAADQLERLRAEHPLLQDAYPCTGMQQGLLLHGARRPQEGLYVNQLRLALDGADPARLRRSWQALVRRHAVLRTAFVDAGAEQLSRGRSEDSDAPPRGADAVLRGRGPTYDGLLQLVMADAEPRWRELDLRATPQDLEARLAEERLEPFDIGRAPLMRLLLVRTGETTQVLAWTFHHALLDGWSMANLVNELLQAYAAPAAADTPAAGPAYRRYIEWLGARDTEASADYWRAYFRDVPVGAAASLPAPLRRSAVADAADALVAEQRAHAAELPPALTEQLGRLARGLGIGLGTLMLGAWGLLVSKYNAEPQVLFGYATSGRPADLPEVEHTAGLFINSLPICVRIDGEQTLADWLAQIQRVQLDHEDHGFLPLAEIQREAGVPAGQALFDSLVVVENYPLDRAALADTTRDGLRVTGVEGVERNGFGLTLVVYPGERLGLKLVYQAHQFDETVTAAMLRQLGQLLAGFAQGGAQPLAALSILSPAERERALVAWNDTQVAYPSEQTVDALFDVQARARGDAPALVHDGAPWSYTQLARRADALAGWLRRHGVRRGDKVALSLDKGPELIAAMLGILKTGAAYVPVALDCPLDRRAFIAADAGIRHVVTQAAHRSQVEVADVATLALEEGDGDAAAGPSLDAGDAQATAYVIYTSGTTGTPKGVAVSHRSLVNFCRWCTGAARCGAGDRVTQFAPYTFDASAGEIFGTLIAGAELHLLDGALIQDPRALTQYLCEHDIRFAAFPPSYAQYIDPTQVPETLSLLTAGSAPAPELVRRWGAQRRYINGYGPTETTVLSSAWMCEPGTIDGRDLSIGRPIANTTMVVVDGVGQLCAPGLVGEIWIGGDGVAQGYVNRPELTAQQFIADPFRPGGRVYRTGDLGRWRDDGCIEFVGRRDRQVKLRGFRIELGEIEACIRQHPGVADTAVLVRGEGAEQQCCWRGSAVPCVPVRGRATVARPTPRRSPTRCAPSCARPCPTTWCRGDRRARALPLTANGKVDRKALPHPGAGTRSPVPPTWRRVRRPKKRLAAIWAEVLKLAPEQVGAHDNFFELGGHSLLAMRVGGARCARTAASRSAVCATCSSPPGAGRAWRR